MRNIAKCNIALARIRYAIGEMILPRWRQRWFIDTWYRRPIHFFSSFESCAVISHEPVACLLISLIELDIFLCVFSFFIISISKRIEYESYKISILIVRTVTKMINPLFEGTRYLKKIYVWYNAWKYMTLKQMINHYFCVLRNADLSKIEKILFKLRKIFFKIRRILNTREYL